MLLCGLSLSAILVKGSVAITIVSTIVIYNATTLIRDPVACICEHQLTVN